MEPCQAAYSLAAAQRDRPENSSPPLPKSAHSTDAQSTPSPGSIYVDSGSHVRAPPTCLELTLSP